MTLSEQAITEFQQLYLKHFGIKLNAEQAEMEAMNLIGLVAVIQPHNTPIIE